MTKNNKSQEEVLENVTPEVEEEIQIDEISENIEEIQEEVLENDITPTKEKKTSENAKKDSKKSNNKNVVSIRAKLLCNCKYGKIGNVVEMSEDTFKAFGEGYVEKTTEELTNKNRPIIIEKSKKEKEEEEKTRIDQRIKAMEERKKNFGIISKAGEKEKK